MNWGHILGSMLGAAFIGFIIWLSDALKDKTKKPKCFGKFSKPTPLFWGKIGKFKTVEDCTNSSSYSGCPFAQECFDKSFGRIIHPETYTIETVNLSEIVLPEGLIKKLPLELLIKHQFAPISRKDNVLACAFGELPESSIINDIETVTAYKIKVVLASKGEIQRHLKELFPELEFKVNNKTSIKDKRKNDAKREGTLFTVFMVVYCGFLGIPGSFGLVGNILVALVLYGIIRTFFNLFIWEKPKGK